MFDHDAPLPYKRSKVHIHQTVKFDFEREYTSEKITIKSVPGAGDFHDKEITKGKREKKVTLKCYGASAEEDRESFFQCLDWMKKQLEPEWTEASKAKNNDAAVLFQAVDAMLISVASTDWHAVLGSETSRKWEMFKVKFSEYICSKVLLPDAYDKQVTYMRERNKPMGLNHTEWYHRLATMNQYLPYFFPTMEALKLEYPTATFPDWWSLGSISTSDQKRVIIHKAPLSHQKALKRVDIGNEARNKLTVEQISEYFATIEALSDEERAKKKKAHDKKKGSDERNDKRDGDASHSRKDWRGKRQSKFSRGSGQKYHDRQGGGREEGRHVSNSYSNQGGRQANQNNRQDSRRNNYSGSQRDSGRDSRRRSEHHHIEEAIQNLINTWDDQFDMEETSSKDDDHRSQASQGDMYYSDEASGGEDGRDSR